MVEISLVVMPFGSVYRPAIGVSLLKAALRKIGVSSKIHYFNLKFAERIGLDVYDKLAETSFDSPLVGELIFSRFVFDTYEWSRQNIRDMVHRIFNSKQYSFFDENRLVNKIIKIQEIIPEFIDDCTYNILREKSLLLGFSSTFEQNCASLALAKRIKRVSDFKIIFGGANCEGDMGASLLKCAPWVDYVCSGEGDLAFLEFVKSFCNGDPNRRINGIITRKSNSLDISLTNPVMDMDALPYPEFDDFFSAFRDNRLSDQLEPELAMETSRGCWWGEKFQCTFCGLNGSTMKYRSKSTSRVSEELRYLRNRYGIRKFQVVDNIMDMKYVDKLFPDIRLQRLDVILFYETKSNISKKQLTVLKEGGVTSIQPGIESLSDEILKIMKKGVTALQNIQILKWCRELNVMPLWNLLWGFPGEPEEEYQRIAEIIPLLAHLHPPRGFGKITLDRFSPYFVDPGMYKLANIRPWIAYKFLYPTLNDEDLHKIAYQFDFDYSDRRDPASYTGELERELLNWKRLWEDQADKRTSAPVLDMVRTQDFIMINDTRPSAVQKLFILADREARIYELCETAHNVPSILIRLQNHYPLMNEDDAVDVLRTFLSKRLMICDNGRYLSLATTVSQEHLV